MIYLKYKNEIKVIPIKLSNNLDDIVNRSTSKIYYKGIKINNNWQLWRFNKKTLNIEPKGLGGSNTLIINAINVNGAPNGSKNMDKFNTFFDTIRNSDITILLETGCISGKQPYIP